MVRFNSRRVGLISLGHWTNGVKENGLTGLGFLTKDGFTGQDGKTWNKSRLRINGMVSKRVKGS